MKRLPPLGAIEAFAVVARQGSLKAAAAELNLSSSAISRRIQVLEHHIGLALFNRHARALTLTAAGETLLDQLIPVIEQFSNAIDTLQILDKSRPLRIGVAPAFTTAWLLPRFHTFRAENPDIHVEFDSAPAAILRLGTDLDGAIIFAAAPPPDHYALRFNAEQTMLACAPTLRDGTPGLRDLADLRHHPLLVYHSMVEMLPDCLAALGVAGFKPKRIETHDNMPILMEAVANGHGVGLVIELLAASQISAGRLVSPFTSRAPSPLDYYFVCRKAGLSALPMRRFRNWLAGQLTPAAALPAQQMQRRN